MSVVFETSATPELTQSKIYWIKNQLLQLSVTQKVAYTFWINVHRFWIFLQQVYNVQPVLQLDILE